MAERTRSPRIVACWLASGVLLASPVAAQPIRDDTLSAAAYLEDFDAAWAFVLDNYAYFDRKQTDWDRVRALYRPLAAAMSSKREFVGVLERMIEELYDPHAHLGTNTSSSPRLVPSGTDLWAEWRGGRAIITDVRAGSEAELAGLHGGLEIIAVDGVPVRAAVQRRLPRALRSADPAAEDWALRAVLAGIRSAAVTVTTTPPDRTVSFVPGSRRPRESLLSVRLLEGGVGHVRVHDALGEVDLIAAWDSALALLRDSRGLVLDLRDTPGGGNSTVARGILSRLTGLEQPYQRHELPSEQRRHGVRRVWVEHVLPRGPFHYDKPVVVLVSRWTGSMGEGIAIGLDAMQRATVVGSPMAGLRGATYRFVLPNTGIGMSIPAERLYHVRGTPREDFTPAVLVPARDRSSADAGLQLAVDLLLSPRPSSPR